MKKSNKISLVILLLAFFCIKVVAQQWSAGINISNMPERDNLATLTIDSAGTLHCVWVHFVNSDFSRIVYSKSYDFGSNWSVPLDLSQNNDTVNYSPQIAISSQNNIYIVYTRETEYPVGVYVCSYKDGFWKQEKIAGMFYQLVKLVIDYNDRVYVFCYYGDQVFYKYYDGLQWSQFYPTYEDYTFVNDLISDHQNRLHFAGLKYIGNLSYRLIYGIFNSDSSTWIPVTELAIDSADMPLIRLDKYDLPHILCRKKYFNNNTWYYPQYYTRFNGQAWSTPVLTAPDIYNHNFFIDQQDALHLFTAKLESTSVKLVYDKMVNSNVTNTSLIDWGNPPYTPGQPQPVFQDNSLGVVYTKVFGAFDSDVYFRKTNLSTYAGDRLHSTKPPELKCYPNPAKISSCIEVDITNPAVVTVSILNIMGKQIDELYNGNLDTGKYKFIWHASEFSKEPTNPGIYFVKLNLDTTTYIEKIIIIN